MGKPAAPTPSEIQTLYELSESDRRVRAAKTVASKLAAAIAKAEIFKQLKGK
jgi:hypothetical protein